MKKTSIKRVNRIRILMIVSHLLLTVFVGQWLLERYRTEKAQLKKELTIEFRVGEQKMVDSLLVDKVINPIMFGKPHKTVKIEIDASNDSIPSILKNITKKKIRTSEIAIWSDSDSNRLKFNFDELKDDSKFFKGKDSSITKKIIFTSDGEPHDKDQLILQGVKLFVEKIIDTTNVRRHSLFAFSRHYDTTILKQYFTNQLDCLKITAHWFDSLLTDSTVSMNEGFFIKSNTLDGNVGAKISHYHTYLLKKLWPNLIFGLLLLLLTGASFAISFMSLKKQIQLNTLRNDFVGNITHELKTPVATIKVALEAIQDPALQPDRQKIAEYISMASHEINRLDLLIQKVLATSIQGQKGNFMQFEPVDIFMLVSEVTRNMSPRLEKLEATIDVTVSGTNFVTFADTLHIQGVLVNLIDNSLKYNVQKPRVDIHIDADEKEIAITVSDNGIGIPKEYRTKIFDTFFRVPTNNLHNIKGYGLGLSYSQMVIRQHGGTIRVVESSEKGTTFAILLPKTVNFHSDSGN